MNDSQIVDLYWQRNERAIAETADRYGSYCYKIAYNILADSEDSEECVNDTWASAWNRIPPVVPRSLKAFLGKLVRDISLNRYIHDRAKKRYSGMEVLLDELEECIPSDFDVERSVEQKELSALLNKWLEALPCDEMALFVQRYYYGDSVKSLAKQNGCTENQMAQKMLKLRKKLKSYLLNEGVSL